MAISTKMELASDQVDQLIKVLKARFENHKQRHQNLDWNAIEAKLKANTNKLGSLNAMEITGGEPDVVGYDNKRDTYIFYDCAAESPKGRRSLCYDREALDSRKEFKPKNSALDMATEMGIEILTEQQYRDLQKLGQFDSKTSSWVKTPSAIRKLGGAIFCDYRFGTVFTYHNGAESYYASRGFRGMIKV